MATEDSHEDAAQPWGCHFLVVNRGHTDLCVLPRYPSPTKPPELCRWLCPLFDFWGNGNSKYFPRPACLWSNWTMWTLNCYLGPGLRVRLCWGPYVAQQGLLLFPHSGNNNRTFSWKRCTVLYWHGWGKNFLPKDQYSCQDMYKERKSSPSIRLANDW